MALIGPNVWYHLLFLMLLQHRSEDARTIALLDEFLPVLTCSPTNGIIYPDPEYVQYRSLVGWHSASNSRRCRAWNASWTIYRHPEAMTRNKALLRFVQHLVPARRINHLQLLLHILALAPEIMSTYLSGLTLAFEPKLAPQWLENINMLARAIHVQPLPRVPPNATVPPALESIAIVADCIVPPTLSRTVLSQGLQHNGGKGLVVYQSLVVLLICLEKLERFQQQLASSVANASTSTYRTEPI